MRVRIVEVPQRRSFITNEEADHYYQMLQTFQIGGSYDLPIDFAKTLLNKGMAIEDKTVQTEVKGNGATRSKHRSNTESNNHPTGSKTRNSSSKRTRGPRNSKES